MRRQSDCVASAQIELFEPGLEPVRLSIHPASKSEGQEGRSRARNAAKSKRDFILAESHHRVKNNLNTVLGMIFLQIDQAKNPETIEALQDASARIRSISVLYEYLDQEQTVSGGSVALFRPYSGFPGGTL